MDNLTHSVIGFGVGELIHRSLPPEPPEQPAPRQQTRHRLLLVSCALASNFPDLDLFLTRLLPAPLGYLLHHRGHTHTALMALPQALLLAALLWLCWPAARALLRASVPARFGLALSIAAGFALHLLMDYTNSYGLHPWYPLDARWFYGDMVFIVEPFFWVAIGVPMALVMRWRLARLAGLAVLLAALAGFAVKGYLGWLSLAVLLLVALACGAAQWRAGPRGRGGLLLALGVGAGFIALQGAASHLGRARIVDALRQTDPGARVLDVAMTAFPSQPLCWAYVSVESDEARGSYRLRRGVAGIAPGWLAPRACPAALLEAGPATSLAAGVLQFAAAEASLAQLRALRDGNCEVDAWLRFARAPQLDTAAGASTITLSDYRFAATPRGNFSSLRVTAKPTCPGGVPGWGYPRADLLSPSSAAP